MADPDLSDLGAFVAVTRARGFRGAASLRGVSPSSLSEAMRRLEAQLGVRLLNRTTRSVTPTEAGQRLLERISPALDDIAGALDTLNSFRDSPTGTLRLNVPIIVAQRVLPALASRFLAAHPGITLEVTTNDAFVDVLAEGFDAGVRYDESIARDMIAVPLGPRTQRYVAAASPAYLAANGTPKHPTDLLRHACIGHRFPSGVLAAWGFVRKGTGREDHADRAADRVHARPRSARRRIGPGADLQLRGIRAARHRAGQAGAGARRVVAELFGPVPVLPEPHAHAGAAARVCRFSEARRVGRPGADSLARYSPSGYPSARIFVRAAGTAP
jgi:DNA-binding transcriptional LysR family regulator